MNPRQLIIARQMSELLSVTIFVALFGNSKARDWRGGFASLGRVAPTFIHAHCELQPTQDAVDHRASKISGRIEFRQPMTAFSRGWLEVRVHIEGLPLDDGISSYGLHIHEWGDLTEGCESTGKHYNPYSRDHGAPSSANRHAGDFGNFMKDRSGGVVKYFLDRVASLTGPFSLIGRAAVLKARTDDLGVGGFLASKVTGSSGGRVACCVIGRSNGDAWRGPTF